MPASETDEELIAEDYWVVQDNCIMKVHEKPRDTLFLPHLDPDCPINVLTLKPDRTTHMRALQSSTIDQKVDRWDNYQFEEKQDIEWVGVTIFHVETRVEEPCNMCHEEVLTISQDQYWECEITKPSRHSATSENRSRRNSIPSVKCQEAKSRGQTQGLD